MHREITQGEFRDTPIQVFQFPVDQVFLDADELRSIFPVPYVEKVERDGGTEDGRKKAHRIENPNKPRRKDRNDGRYTQ